MIWGLGSLELRVFKTLCSEPQGDYGKSMASHLGLKESAVSRALTALAGKKLVVLERSGKRKLAVVSDASHALALKAFFVACPHVDAGVLAHSSIRVLSGLLFPNASVARVRRVGFLREITVRRVLSKLLDAGVVGRRSANDYYILLPLLQKAVEEYVSFAVMQSKQDVNGSLISRGPYGFIRTGAEKVPSFMTPTGLSVLSEFGVKVIQTDFEDYYYNVFGSVKRPCLEEAIVHALLRSTLLPSAREASYALLALHKNKKKVSEEKFFVVAGDLGVEGAARQSLEFVDAFAAGHEIKHSVGDDFLRVRGPVFPGFEEFKELIAQYG